MANYASELIEVAEKEVGYLEKKSNTSLYDKTKNAGNGNYTKYAAELDEIEGFYNGRKNGYAWCAVFVDWCFVKAFGLAAAKKLTYHTIYGASCTLSAKQYKENGRFYSGPKVGDEIFFTDSKGEVCHTGLVYKVDSNYVYTIEGNTSAESGVVANGGAVAKKKYLRSYGRIYGYGRPKYDAEKKVVASNNANLVKEWQLAAIKDGFKFSKYGADGKWGSECEAVAKKAVCKKRLLYKYKNLTKIVQRIVGVTADGKYGNDTKQAVIKWQRANKLIADGEVGVNTWKKMLGVK